MKTVTCLIGLAVATAGLCDARGVRGGQRDRPAAKTGADSETAREADPRAGDLAAIRALNQAFLRDFNDGDARAIASMFTEDARIIDEEGRITEGRAAIEARFAATFEDDPGGTLKLATDSIRFLADDVAIEEGAATLTPAEGRREPETAKYTVVYVKREGHWLQANLRDHPRSTITSPREHLKDLAWMIGDWISEGGDTVVSSSCRWAEGENFLLRTFSVEAEGQTVLSGNERIGWDPVTEQFKSWVFDSDGGFGEGTWHRAEDGRWIQKASGVRSDGQVASATRHVTIESKDRFAWTIVDRTVSTHALPDGTFVMVRKPPKPM